jgi:hypothetical protein
LFEKSFQDVIKEDVFIKNMENMEKENSVAKQELFVLELNVEKFQENANLLVKS